MRQKGVYLEYYGDEATLMLASSSGVHDSRTRHYPILVAVVTITGNPALV